MQLLVVQVVFVVLLVMPAPVKTEHGGVQFWGKTVTLTCPYDGKWFKNFEKNAVKNNSKSYEFEYDGRVQYRCEYSGSDGTETYRFYVEGKACINCFELDASLILGVLSVDVVVTLVVMMIVYKCTRKKHSAGPANSSKAQTRSGGRAPPVPHPDYESLNPHTRSQDPYSFVKRTG